MSDDQLSGAAVLRVSCAGLCRIADADGRYLLGLNKNRLSQGIRLYTALGGALEYSQPDLLTRFDATPEDATRHELRLFMAEDKIPAFRAWFFRRRGREISPFRELYEELIDEYGVLTTLDPADVAIEYLYTYQHRRKSGRSGMNGALTHYLHDVFDVSLIAPTLRETLYHIPPETGLRWVTSAEIRHSATDDGAQVDAMVLLHDQD